MEQQTLPKSPIVMIEWEDSRQPKSAWQWVSDYEKPNIVHCVSVGWLVHDGENVKILAPNAGDIEDEDMQVSGVIQIPARCVTRITPLTIKKVRTTCRNASQF